MRYIVALLLVVLAFPVSADSTIGACSGFTAELRPDGQVFCCGRNDHGQLGIGTIGGSSAIPVAVLGLSGVKAISVGDDYVVALDATGVLWTWGANSSNCLGRSAAGDSGTPAPVTGLPPVRFVSAGHAHVLCIDQNGLVWGFGTATSGELGPGITSTATPVQMPVLTGVREVAAGYDFSLALRGNGNVFVWGSNAAGGLGVGTSSPSTPTAWPSGHGTPLAYSTIFKHIVAGKQVLALAANGTVCTWGYGGAYATGLGSSSNVLTPTIIPGLSHIKEVVTMGDNSGAIDTSGQLWLWGGNASNSLGMETSGAITSPTSTGIMGMTSLGGSSDHVMASGPSSGLIGVGSNSSGQLAMGTQTSASGWEPSCLTDSNGYSAVVAGHGFTLVLYKDGTVHSVGRNDVSELGLGSTGSAIATDAQIPGLSHIIALAAGDRFGLALRADQTVWSWGNNDFSQLGLGTTIDAANPLQIPGLSGIAMIAAGADHAVAVSKTGSVYVWGRGNHYQTGKNSQNEISTPTLLTGFTGTPLAVSVSGDHNLLLTTVGLYAWGSNGAGECGQGTTSDVQTPVLVSGLSNIIQIAAGRKHSLVMTTSGLFAWGDDQAGELADGANVNQTTPEAVSLPSGFNSPVLSISAGNGTSFIQDAFCYIWASGLNTSGQLGLYSTDNVSTLTETNGFGVQVAAGYSHTALLFPGYILSAGDNVYNELDDGSTYSAPYFSIEGFLNPPTTDGYVGLAAGTTHSLAIDEQGQLWGFGADETSELGDGGTSAQLTPTLTASGLNLIAISAGYRYSMGIDDSGNVLGWGLSTAGQTGTGINSGGLAPQPINFSHAIQVACGYDHAWILRDDGTVWGIGNSADGALTSAASTPTQLAPIQITGLFNIVAIAAGKNFSLALSANGQMFAFGAGTSGQLGDSQTSNSSSSVLVTIPPSISIAAGNAHGLAVDWNGACWAWGSGASGQNGSTTFSNTTAPTQITNSGIGAAAGGAFSEFLTANGGVLTFGADDANQLDDSFYVTRSYPLIVSNLSPVTSLAPGGSHVLSLMGLGGGLTTWGDDSAGALGDGQVSASSPPPPSNFTATANGATEIDLTWTASAGASNYELWRSTDSGITFTFVSAGIPGSQTSYHAIGLLPGTTYIFEIAALNAGGPSSKVVSHPVQTAYTTPTTPINVITGPSGPGGLTLAWNNQSNEATSISVQQENPDGSWTTIATLPPTATTYAISGASTETPNSYRLVVSNPAGSVISAVTAAAIADPYPYYAVADIGDSDFGPTYLADNGTVIGYDENFGTLERWDAGAISDLTVNGASVSWLDVGGVGTNNNGDVVSCIKYTPDATDTFTEALHWPSGGNDAIPITSPILTFSNAPYDSTVTSTMSYLVYTAITDDGAIYGTQLAQAAAFSSQPGGLYQGGTYVLPGSTAPNFAAGLTLDEYNNNQELRNNAVLGYSINYDGYEFASNTPNPTELGNTALNVTGGTYTVQDSFPLFASSGLLVTSNYTGFPGSWGGQYTVNGAYALDFTPRGSTNGGVVYGQANSGQYVWWDLATQTDHVLPSGVTILSANANTTGGAPDFQFVDGSNLYQMTRDTSGALTSSFESYPLRTLLAAPPGWTVAGVCINDSKVLAGFGSYTSQGPGDTTATPGDHSILLVPVEVQYVNRDDGEQSWTNMTSEPGVMTIYGGKTSGDMVKWKLDCPSSWQSGTFTWSAMDSQGNVIAGPSGVGVNYWQISNGGNDPAGQTRVTWRPDTYVVRCNVTIGSSSIPIQFSQKVGWRTEDYVVIGQIVATSTYANRGPSGLIAQSLFKGAMMTDCAGIFSLGAVLAPGSQVVASNLPCDFLGAFDLIAWGGWPHALTPNGPLSYSGSVTDDDRFWILEQGLNFSVDTPISPSEIAGSAIQQTITNQEYRVIEQYQVRFSLTPAGIIDSGSIFDIKAFGQGGPTKLTVPANVFSSEGITLPSDYSWPVLASDENQNNGEYTSTDKRSQSFYASARIAYEGQNANWHIFGQDVPWIYSEVVSRVGTDRTVSSKIRMSVDTIWNEDGTISGNTNFNNLNIYRGTSDPRTGTYSYVLQGAPLSMEGKLDRFINSVPYGTWPTPPTKDSLQ